MSHRIRSPVASSWDQQQVWQLGSCELYSPKHWEWDLWEIARVTKEGMLRYVP